jgi:hypothetical protein
MVVLLASATAIPRADQTSHSSPEKEVAVIKAGQNTFRAAALLSCLSALLAFLARVFGMGEHVGELTTAKVTTALGTIGLLASVAAISGMRRHGTDGILVPAAIGLICGIWMIFTSVLVLLSNVS